VGAKAVLALGILLLASGVILPQQGVQYIQQNTRNCAKSLIPPTVFACANAHVGAWRDLRTGYVCDFDHNGYPECYWPPCDGRITRQGDRCGYSGWYGYTEYCVAYNLNSPDWGVVCTKAEIRG
jgi:hypothetical protein